MVRARRKSASGGYPRAADRLTRLIFARRCPRRGIFWLPGKSKPRGDFISLTDKVNIPELQNRLQRRIDLSIETARDWSKLRASKIEA
jgi:hypothetical protein